MGRFALALVAAGRIVEGSFDRKHVEAILSQVQVIDVIAAGPMVKKGDIWRLTLRDNVFLDQEPPPKDVPTEVIKAVRTRFEDLQKEWDRMYPANPVSSDETNKPKDTRHDLLRIQPRTQATPA